MQVGSQLLFCEIPQPYSTGKKTPLVVKMGNSEMDVSSFFNVAKKRQAGREGVHLPSCRHTLPSASHPGDFLARAEELTCVRGARLEVRTCSVSQMRSQVLEAEVQ